MCGQFHVKLDETGCFVFCFFGSKMKLAVVSWVKLAKIVKPSRFGREKIETEGRGEAACRQFQFFFRPNSGGFTILCQFHPWNHQPVSFFEPIKTVKQNSQFHPVFTWNCATSQNKNKCGFYWNLIFSIKQSIKSRARFQ